MTTVLGRRREPSGERSPASRRPLRTRGDLVAAAVAAALVAAASLIGWTLIDADVPVLVGWPPVLAEWLPHVGPGTVPAILVALVVALRGPAIARTMRWGPLLITAFAAALAW